MNHFICTDLPFLSGESLCIVNSLQSSRTLRNWTLYQKQYGRALWVHPHSPEFRWTWLPYVVGLQNVPNFGQVSSGGQPHLTPSLSISSAYHLYVWNNGCLCPLLRTGFKLVSMLAVLHILLWSCLLRCMEWYYILSENVPKRRDAKIKKYHLHPKMTGR